MRKSGKRNSRLESARQRVKKPRHIQRKLMRGRRGPEEVTRRERAGRRGDAWDQRALKRGARL